VRKFDKMKLKLNLKHFVLFQLLLLKGGQSEEGRLTPDLSDIVGLGFNFLRKEFSTDCSVNNFKNYCTTHLSDKLNRLSNVK
jgi:hypothetical protein